MIRLATTNDLDIINSMLKEFNTKITLEELESHPFKRYLINEQSNGVVAFLSYSDLYENMEIEYLYTNPDKRKRGFGHELVKELIKQATEKKCSNISLEVRISNLDAINLYKSFGFTAKTVRSKYYEGEDALLMVKKIGD